MARRRFFVDEIRAGAAELRGEEARHLTRVLRVEAGQRFEISDNRQAWLAEIDEASRNWPRVVTDMRAIVELAPNDLSARLKLGKLLLLAGSTDEALRLANAGIELDNRNADVRALKAAIAFKLNDRAGAVREAQVALELDPANADAVMVLAVDRLGKDDAKGALALLEGASVVNAKDNGNNLGLQLLKIKLFGQTGDFKSVEVALKKLAASRDVFGQ